MLVVVDVVVVVNVDVDVLVLNVELVVVPVLVAVVVFLFQPLTNSTWACRKFAGLSLCLIHLCQRYRTS